MDDNPTARRQAALNTMNEHGGYPEPEHCPTHGQRRCTDWADAWADYEKAVDDERAARGERRLYVYRPLGRATW